MRSAHTRFCTRTLMETAAITSSQHCMHLCCTTGSTTQGQSVDPELSCTLCHKAQDSADMLVCDECHHGMHMGCMGMSPQRQASVLLQPTFFCPACELKFAELRASAAGEAALFWQCVQLYASC